MKAIVTLNIDVDQLKETYKEKNGSLEGFSLESEISAELGWASSSGISVDKLDKVFEESSMLHFFISLGITEGEREYSEEILVSLPNKKQANKFADFLAKNFRDKDAELEDDGYYHDGGEIFVTVKRVHEIPESEFQSNSISVVYPENYGFEIEE